MGYAPLPAQLTLDEAAKALTERLGNQWTARHVLSCAAQDEIRIYARIPIDLHLKRFVTHENEDDEIKLPAGSLACISTFTAEALLRAPSTMYAKPEQPIAGLEWISGEDNAMHAMQATWCIPKGKGLPEISISACIVLDCAVEQLVHDRGDSSLVSNEERLKRWWNETSNDRNSRPYIKDKAEYERVWSLDVPEDANISKATPAETKEQVTPQAEAAAHAEADKPQAAPAVDGSALLADMQANTDESLAELFDPVTVAALEKMLPANGKWISWAERAARNGLATARRGRGVFNPYHAAFWFLTQGIAGWDTARVNRALANNLPARSRHNGHLLTGNMN